MYRDGFLKATSVGFQPLKYAFTDDPQRRFGIDFLEQELIEFSLVTVPANAEALIEGRKAGINVDPLIESLMTDERTFGFAEKIAQRKDLFSRSFIERLAGIAGIPILTVERQRNIERLERAATQQRLKSKREQKTKLLRLGA
jgi:hypothetical protein